MDAITPPPARSPAQRRADTLTKLQAPAADVWVASAAAGDHASLPYLVPLSLAWIDQHVVIALEASSRTARNILATRTARLGLGPTRDVVLIDADLADAVAVQDAPPELADRYAAQADWDPRTAPGAYTYLTLRPVRIQAWREANELDGRTLMRDGSWIT